MHNMTKIAPSKSDTALLPLFPTLGLDRIVIPATSTEFAAAAADILAAGAVGFDSESKPTFSPGEVSSGPHVVQFALPTKAYLFLLHWPDCRASLVHLLQDTSLRKVGFGLEQDRGQIQAKFGVLLAGAVDLNRYFHDAGYGKSMGVRAAVGVVLHQRFHKSKKTTTSNWAQPRLTAAQQLYAANDAYAALKVFQAL